MNKQIKMQIPDIMLLNGLHQLNKPLETLIYMARFEKDAHLLFYIDKKEKVPMVKEFIYWSNKNNLYGVGKNWYATKEMINYLRKLEGKSPI